MPKAIFVHIQKKPGKGICFIQWILCAIPMKQITYSIIFLIILSCNPKKEKAEPEAEIPDYSVLLNEFKAELIKTVEQINENNNDSLSTSIEIDTLFLFGMKDSKVYSALAQYRTTDNKLKLGIIGIGNFDNNTPPTFKLIDSNADLYIADSSFILSDSLILKGHIQRDNEAENFRVAFDLQFDGSYFPWNYE